MTGVSRSIRQVPDAPATKVTRRGGGIHASMARKGLGQSKSGPFVRLDPLACPLCADFVAEVAEEESGPWRRATSLACHSPVRAVAGDPTRLWRDLTLTPRMRPRVEAAVPRAWPTSGGSERSLPA